MRIKIWLLASLIFALGFGSGFLFSGRLTRNRIEEVKERETPQGFKKDLYHYLKPDENQKRLIDSIVATYVPVIREEREMSRQYQKHLRDSMMAQIRLLLNKDQEKDLKKFKQEKLSRKQPPVAGETKPDPETVREHRMRRFEAYRNSLSPEERQRLDSVRMDHRKGKTNGRPRDAYRNYVMDSMLPVLLEYRQSFDQELTAEERAVLEGLRIKRQKLRGDWLMMHYGGGDSIENKVEYRVFMEEARMALQKIVRDHRSSLERINQELLPYRQKWEQDMNAIRQRNKPGSQPPPEGKWRNARKNTVDFLLLDPSPNAYKPK